jgi:hypothetical protein
MQFHRGAPLLQLMDAFIVLLAWETSKLESLTALSTKVLLRDA